MIRKEVHSILDMLIDEGERGKLYGQTSFIMHWQEGKIKQVTDEKVKRTWKGPDAQT